ncbi:MAG: hypothetical protein Athens041674_434 [Parcubacteria group bacterium Athens0416_74]|nr:MAG: hypothetical protein Athens041674_434 [Parcubacteria group bacterium Athens0416_74]
MFDADIVIVSRLAGVLESALQTETFLSGRRIAREAGISTFRYRECIRKSGRISRLVYDFQKLTIQKNGLGSGKLSAKVAQAERESQSRKRIRRLKKLLRWKTRWKYDKAVRVLDNGGFPVTMTAIALVAGVPLSTVQSYLQDNPRHRNRYKIVRFPGRRKTVLPLAICK